MSASVRDQSSLVSELRKSPEAQKSLDGFAEGVNRVEPEDFLKFMVDYVDFNAHIPAGMLCAAAAVHASEELFPPSGGNPISQASIISSYMLVAVEDEFASPTGDRVTHRALNRALLAGTYAALGRVDGDGPPVRKDYRPVIDRIYGMWQEPTPERVLRSIGVHYAAEFSGGAEMIVIDERLRRIRPDVVARLESERSPYTGAPVYTWVKTHLAVEDEHADAAGTAIELARTNSIHPDTDELIAAGFHEWFELLDLYTENSLL